ncbi:MAG: hypothetical protein ACI9YH_003247, partial [Colwellia sp.]
VYASLSVKVVVLLVLVLYLKSWLNSLLRNSRF